MSANHKRPFYVFAVVAAICSLVLVTGIRSSKAESSPGDETVASDTSGAPFALQRDGHELKPVDVSKQKARVVHALMRDTDGGSGNGSGPLSGEGTEPPPGAPGSGGNDEPSSVDLDPQDREPPGTPGTENLPDDVTSIETRPDEESQTNTPNEDPDGDTDGDTDTDEDIDEEEPGTLGDEETEDPSGEGDGFPDQDQSPSPGPYGIQDQDQN